MFKMLKVLISTTVFCILFFIFSVSVFATSSETLTTTGANVNIRSGPGTSYKVVGKLDKGQKVSLIEKSGIWYKVKVSETSTAWVSNSFVSASATTASRGSLEDRTATKIVSQSIISLAKKYLGVSYVWGGASSKGFDCSGFVQYVFGKFKIELDHSARAQASVGTKISKSNLLPGDLVFFDTNGNHNGINHVGIYVGSGKFIQASSGKGNVVISSLTSGFYSESYMTARRVM